MITDTEGATRLDKLGKYKIEGILRKGVMRIVYLAFDTVIKRYVALKTVRTELRTADLLASFKREVQAAGRCHHPNIVSIFEYGEEQGLPYIAMEYMEGQDLKCYLKEKTRLNVETALRIIIQTLNALGYVHAQGIVHCDIKPGNVIVLTDEFVKVTNFSIARLYEPNITQYGIMTQYGLVIGSPDYKAPEQFTDGPITPATDLYASGLILFKLLTGRELFTGRTSEDIMNQVLDDRSRNNVKLNPQVPVGLQKVLYKVLAIDPGERFQSAKEFSSALREIDAPNVSKDPLYLASLERVTQELTIYLGPIAKMLVRKTAAQVSSLEAMYTQLASHIPQESERAAFLKRCRLLSSS